MCAGACVSFCSRRQNTLGYAFFEVGGVRGDGHAFLRRDFHVIPLELCFPGPRCWTYQRVEEENEGAIHLANNPVASPNSTAEEPMLSGGMASM